MKVCHMTSAHDSDDVRIFHKECTSLARAGYNTYLVARGESREENGVHVIGVGNAPTRRIQRMTTFAKALYRVALELDAEIYHIHDPELLPYALKLKKKGKKVIFDSHEIYPMQIAEKHYLPKPVRYPAALFYKAYETFVIKRLDAVIVPCTIEGKNVFDNRSERTAIVNNYPLKSEFYDKFDVTASLGQYVCYVGGISESRGIFSLVEACAKAEIKLVLAGPFSPASLESDLKALPGYAYVDYRGILKRSGVAEVLSGAKVGACVLMNKGQYNKPDTLGTKVYEYMSLGLPVIINDYTYARKTVIDKYKCGICVDPDDVDAIADAIIYLRDHPDEARQMGLNGRRAVEKEFNWNTQEIKLLELYEEISGDKCCQKKC